MKLFCTILVIFLVAWGAGYTMAYRSLEQRLDRTEADHEALLAWVQTTRNKLAAVGFDTPPLILEREPQNAQESIP